MIIIEHAERLRSNMPDLVVPLARLVELACVDNANLNRLEVR